MSRNYAVTEPHPSVPKTGGYIYGGRGGAGNYKRYEPSQLSSGPDATGPASRISLSRTYKRPFVAGGRGGAGNMYTPTEPETPMFQFDEELKRRETHCAPVYHVGRGGAANFVDETKPRSVRLGSTDSASSAASHASRSSLMDGNPFNKLARKLSKN